MRYIVLGGLAALGTLVYAKRYDIADLIVYTVLKPIEDDEPNDQIVANRLAAELHGIELMNQGASWNAGTADIPLPSRFRTNPSSPLTGRPLPMNDD